MLNVTYKERCFIDKYTCIDNIKNIIVKNKAFTQGDLVYFKKDNFNYFVIENNLILDIKEV
jgi:hypothetical protein